MEHHQALEFNPENVSKRGSGHCHPFLASLRVSLLGFSSKCHPCVRYDVLPMSQAAHLPFMSLQAAHLRGSSEHFQRSEQLKDSGGQIRCLRAPRLHGGRPRLRSYPPHSIPARICEVHSVRRCIPQISAGGRVQRSGNRNRELQNPHLTSTDDSLPYGCG